MLELPHILVVDDEMHVQNLVRHTFEGEGYRVSCAGNADDAIKAVEGSTPDLVLLDVRMPGKDGYHVLDHITRNCPGIHVVFLTAQSKSDEIVRGLDSGAGDYVTKPFSTRELLVRVEGILRRAGGAG